MLFKTSFYQAQHCQFSEAQYIARNEKLCSPTKRTNWILEFNFPIDRDQYSAGQLRNLRLAVTMGKLDLNF